MPAEDILLQQAITVPVGIIETRLADGHGIWQILFEFRKRAIRTAADMKGMNSECRGDGRVCRGG